MKYLVCRTDATALGFPIMVEIEEGIPAENIVMKAFNSINRGYIGMHEYLVVSLKDARLVKFSPKPAYDVQISRFDPGE